MSDSKFYLGQLRHAYKQAVDGVIGDQRSYAAHLLGPAVADAEKAYEERDRLKAALAVADELIEDLMGYAMDAWDWKYGNYWREEQAKVRAALGPSDNSSSQSKEPK